VTKPQVTIAPDLLAQFSSDCEYTSLVSKARALGLIVEIDVLNRPETDLMVYGRQRKARYILITTQAPTYKLVDGDRECNVTLEQLSGEMTSWKR
jgi:hypothetical protein